MRRVWANRIITVVIALAAPAFAFVTFDRLIKHAEQPTPQPTLVETYRRAGADVGKSLRGVGNQLRAIDGVLKPHADEAPPSPVADVPAGPSELRVPVLVYHNIREAEGQPAMREYDVTPAELAAQFTYLAERGYTPITMSAVVDALAGRPLPSKPVAITFDDGRADQYENAVPLLKKHGFVATFYVFTNAIGRPGYLTQEQMAELTNDGNEIGSHAVYHPYLTKLDDADLKNELERSKADLEARLGASVRTFAYPFGMADERVVAATRAAGYDSARGLDHSYVISKEGAFAMPGYVATGSLSAFRAIVDGAE